MKPISSVPEFHSGQQHWKVIFPSVFNAVRKYSSSAPADSIWGRTAEKIVEYFHVSFALFADLFFLIPRLVLSAGSMLLNRTAPVLGVELSEVKTVVRSPLVDTEGMSPATKIQESKTGFDSHRIDPSLPLSQNSFTDWAINKIKTSNFLNPSRYELRPIEDKGCISHSLETSKLNLFDRAPAPSSFLMRSLSKVASCGLILLIPLGLPVAMCCHTSLALKHTGEVLRQQGEKRDQTWNKVYSHTKLVFEELKDLFLCCAYAGVMGAVAGSLTLGDKFVSAKQLMHLDSLPVTGAILSGVLLYGLGHVGESFSSQDCYGYNKALFLRNEFGVVSPDEGLLTWDSDQDQDVLYSEAFSNFSFLRGLEPRYTPNQVLAEALNAGHGMFAFKLVGYFSSLYKQQRLTYLNVIKSLKLQLPSQVASSIADNSTSKDVLNCLKKHQDVIGLSSDDIANWKQQLESSEENAQALARFIETTNDCCYGASRFTAPNTRTTLRPDLKLNKLEIKDLT